MPVVLPLQYRRQTISALSQQQNVQLSTAQIRLITRSCTHLRLASTWLFATTIAYTSPALVAYPIAVYLISVSPKVAGLRTPHTVAPSCCFGFPRRPVKLCIYRLYLASYTHLPFSGSTSATLCTVPGGQSATERATMPKRGISLTCSHRVLKTNQHSFARFLVSPSSVFAVKLNGAISRFSSEGGGAVQNNKRTNENDRKVHVTDRRAAERLVAHCCTL